MGKSGIGEDERQPVMARLPSVKAFQFVILVTL